MPEIMMSPPYFFASVFRYFSLIASFRRIASAIFMISFSFDTLAIFAI